MWTGLEIEELQVQLKDGGGLKYDEALCKELATQQQLKYEELVLQAVRECLANGRWAPLHRVKTSDRVASVAGPWQPEGSWRSWVSAQPALVLYTAREWSVAKGRDYNKTMIRLRNPLAFPSSVPCLACASAEIGM